MSPQSPGKWAGVITPSLQTKTDCGRDETGEPLSKNGCSLFSIIWSCHGKGLPSWDFISRLPCSPGTHVISFSRWDRGGGVLFSVLPLGGHSPLPLSAAQQTLLPSLRPSLTVSSARKSSRLPQAELLPFSKGTEAQHTIEDHASMSTCLLTITYPLAQFLRAPWSNVCVCHAQHLLKGQWVGSLEIRAEPYAP